MLNKRLHQTSEDQHALQMQPPGWGFDFYLGLEKAVCEAEQRDGGSGRTVFLLTAEVWNNWSLFLTWDQINVSTCNSGRVSVPRCLRWKVHSSFCNVLRNKILKVFSRGRKQTVTVETDNTAASWRTGTPDLPGFSACSCKESTNPEQETSKVADEAKPTSDLIAKPFFWRTAWSTAVLRAKC